MTNYYNMLMTLDIKNALVIDMSFKSEIPNGFTTIEM